MPVLWEANWPGTPTVISASFASSVPTHRGAAIGTCPTLGYGLHTIPTGSFSVGHGIRGGPRLAFFCSCTDMFLDNKKYKLVDNTVNCYPYVFIIKTAHAVTARTRSISGDVDSSGCQTMGVPNMPRSCASCTACRRIIQLRVALPWIFMLHYGQSIKLRNDGGSG